MRFLFRPPAAEATGLLSLPWGEPLAEWDPELLLEVPQRGISRHVVRFVASGGQVFALKEINERLARKEYRLLAEFEEEGLPTVSVLGICVDRPGDQEAILVTRYLEYSMSYRWLFSRPQVRTPPTSCSTPWSSCWSGCTWPVSSGATARCPTRSSGSTRAR